MCPGCKRLPSTMSRRMRRPTVGCMSHCCWRLRRSRSRCLRSCAPRRTVASPRPSPCFRQSEAAETCRRYRSVTGAFGCRRARRGDAASGCWRRGAWHCYALDSGVGPVRGAIPGPAPEPTSGTAGCRRAEHRGAGADRGRGASPDADPGVAREAHPAAGARGARDRQCAAGGAGGAGSAETRAAVAAWRRRTATRGAWSGQFSVD